MRKSAPRAHVVWAIRIAIGVMALILAVGVELLRPESLSRLDEGLRDTYVRRFSSDDPENRIAVIDIDEAALKEFGPWPWPRDRIADLVEVLFSTYGAKAVGLDIIFPDQINKDKGDARLAALATHAPLVLAQILDYVQRTPTVREGVLAGGLDTHEEMPSIEAHGYIANNSNFSTARCVGNIGYIPDADGVLRRTPILTAYQGGVYPQFASVLLSCGQESVSHVNAGPGALWRIPYWRSQQSYTVISAAEILNERVSRVQIAGRYVLIGSSSLSIGDRVSTPLAPLSAGVMVHAASLTGLLDLIDGRVDRLGMERTWLFLWIALSVTVAISFISRMAAWASVLLIFTLAAGWGVIGFIGIHQGAEWSLTAPMSAYLLLLTVAIPFEWWQSQLNARRLLDTFSHYVAQPVLDEIVRLDMQHSLNPTLKRVTVLIADMEGYTRATSTLSLEDAATLTKEFLACLTDPVLAWRGTLDKYTGDGLVAFWGAPLICPDQADRAINAALDMLASVNDFNISRAATGLPPVRVRIGVESGNALVGDLGTAFRSTYTAVGDCINFASRLEAATRELSTDLAIGSEANSQITCHQTVPLGRISIRGTLSTIEVFTVPSITKAYEKNKH